MEQIGNWKQDSSMLVYLLLTIYTKEPSWFALSGSVISLAPLTSKLVNWVESL